MLDLLSTEEFSEVPDIGTDGVVSVTVVVDILYVVYKLRYDCARSAPQADDLHRNLGSELPRACWRAPGSTE